MTFKQKMNALQRFLNHGMSRFSIDTWHHALSDLFYSYQQAHFDDGRLDGQALTKVTSVSHLRALSRDVILHREGGSMRETDAHGLKYLENFLAAVQCLKEAKACVDSVFQYMYYNYYDPDAGKSKESSSVHSAKTRRHAAENGNHVMTATDVRDLQLDASSFGILTLEQMTGSTQHKLRRTVSDMKEIMSRWDHLQTEDEIHLDDLDPESQQDLLMLHGTASFEQVLRLLPDIFAKYYKCLELAKQWWVLAHEIYPELPMGRQPTPDIISPQDSEGGSEGRSESRSEDAVTDSRQSPVNQMSEHNAPSTEELEAVLEEIQKKEELLQSLQDELDMLDERERHFESLVETYENVTAQLENKIREKKELATARERQTQLGVGESFQEGGADNRSSGRHRRESADSSQSLDAQIEKSEREIQLLQFQQALLLQDYMIQLEVRPSLIRFTEDLKLRIQDAHQGLTEHKTEKSRLENLAQNADASEKREDDAKTDMQN
nr:hypothetical protein BaRGS_034187 [Batillaria attramentaria]